MSPTVATMPAQPKNPKGKRIPGKRGRFSPDRAFHMSTRRGNKTSISGSAPSLNGSVEDFESRRESLDAERPVTAHSNGTQASKGTYASDFSPPQPVPDIDMSDVPPINSTEDAIEDDRRSRSPTRIPQTFSSTLKRKRSSPSPPPAATQETIQHENEVEAEAPQPDDQYDSDTVQVVHQDDLSDREEGGDDIDQDQIDDTKDDSPGSSQSQEVMLPYDAMAGTSVDVTPMLSEQPSPATSGSAEDDDQEPDTAIAKPLAAALNEVAKANEATEAEIEPPEDASMLDAGAAVDDADEIEEQVRTDDEGRMVVRRGRFGGRRRAQHPNAHIEMAMRRQAQLKSAYRAIARAQKGLLSEITSRTIDELEANPAYHTEVSEYESIIKKLDATLAKRKATIQAQHDMRKKQLQVTWDGERESIVSKCRQQLEDAEECKVDQLEYEVLRIARRAQLEDGNETEDEDEVIPRLKRTAYNFKRGDGLDRVYDSRSRIAIETRLATKDLQSRYDMYDMLKELPHDEQPEKRKDFTVMDERPRTAALKNREGQDNLEVLAAAGAEAERIAKIPVIPNEHAFGLQMLSDLASRPSITQGRPESSGSIAGQVNNMAGLPQLPLQVPSRHSPIQVTMSPRTQHAMGNRFEAGHMGPPLTPRQEATFPGNPSQEVKRHDRQPSTPNMGNLVNGFPDRPSMETLRSPARPVGSEANSLQNRIASRDGALQDSLFGSRGAFADLPGFRQFESPGGPRRRASHSDPAPPFGPHSDPVSMMLRGDLAYETERKSAQDETRKGSRMFDPVRSQTSTLPDQPSRAGASNGRKQETASPKSENISIDGISATQNFANSGQDTSSTPNSAQHAKKSSKNGAAWQHKTSREDRGGRSRKQLQNERKQQKKLENGRPESAGTSSVSASHFTGSPAFGMRTPPPWSGGPPPLHSPIDFAPPPPPGPHHHSASYGHPPGFPPPSSSLPPHLQRHGSLDLSNLHHRESFPPPRPLIAPPQHSTHFPILNQNFNQPPPPGVAAEQWRPGPGGPPGMPNFGPPAPPPHHQPHHPLPPGAPFPRGTPLAPAGGPGTPGAFNPGPFRPANNHPPAFAQQQQQQNGGNPGAGNGNGSGRRRTQSDVTFAKFQPLWEPPGGRKRGG